MQLFLPLVALALVVGCQQSPTQPETLPPSGLAGLPGAPIKTAPVSTALPGAGVPVFTPSGDIAPTADLPPGHPPINGAAPATAAGAALPAEPSAGAEVTLSGSVLETMDGAGYTYMRLKTIGGEEWVAINAAKIAVGDQVVVVQSIVMNQFPSKSLNRTFDKLVMGSLVGEPKKGG